MLQTRAGLIQVALGRIPSEMLIRNIRLVNVYTGEILGGQEVGVWQGRIAFVRPVTPSSGAETQVIDGQGMYLAPGFLDVHGHADLLTNPLALARHILPTGTTGMLTDSHDICGAIGVKGLELMLEATADIPFRYYFSAPVACPPLPEFEGPEVFTKEVVASSLAHKRVLAVSEVTAWGRLMIPETEFVAKLVMAQELGKRVEGHLAGCSKDKLNALIACGFTSCHESINAEEALQKLRLGLHVILRHGSVRADLEPLSRLITDHPDLDTSRVMLSPDWFSPRDVLKYGYMNYLVAEAVRLGIPPVKAIQMVTINPATYLGMESEIGGIAPGRLADLILMQDLKNFTPELVLVGGKIVAQHGKLEVDLPDFPKTTLQDWRKERVPTRPVRADDFRLSAGTNNPEVACIQMVNKTITRAVIKTLTVKHGQIDISANPELLKISLWSAPKDGWVTAMLEGFTARVGGIASSIGHETHSPMVVGYSDGDMALAANRMLEMGGGIVIVQEGRILHELPLTVGGILSSARLEEVAAGWSELNHYLQGLGCPWDDPLFGLGFLSFTGLPYVRITHQGVVDIRKKELIFPKNSGGV